jgi:hypothetical protein
VSSNGLYWPTGVAGRQDGSPVLACRPGERSVVLDLGCA